MTVAKTGQEVEVFVDSDSEDLAEYFGVLNHLCYRSFMPIKQLQIEKINGASATTSAYLAVIVQCFNVFRDHKVIVIQREL